MQSSLKKMHNVREYEAQPAAKENSKKEKNIRIIIPKLQNEVKHVTYTFTLRLIYVLKRFLLRCELKFCNIRSQKNT